MPEEYLTTLHEARHKPTHDRTNPVATTEAVGDPDEDSLAAGGQAGAAGGAVLGGAVAGPIGLAVGAALGGAAGAAGEAADPEDAAERDQRRKETQLRRHEEHR